MCVKRKPTTTARKVAIATCNVALLNRDNLKVQNPFVWWRTQSVAAVVAVMVVAMANRTGRYVCQWRRRARDEHVVFGIKLRNMF
jgi:hypothetical protein